MPSPRQPRTRRPPGATPDPALTFEAEADEAGAVEDGALTAPARGGLSKPESDHGLAELADEIMGDADIIGPLEPLRAIQIVSDTMRATISGKLTDKQAKVLLAGVDQVMRYSQLIKDPKRRGYRDTPGHEETHGRSLLGSTPSFDHPTTDD